VVQSALLAFLVLAVGFSTLLTSIYVFADITAIGLALKAGPANVKHLPTRLVPANPLVENNFLLSVHNSSSSSRKGLDRDDRMCEGRILLFRDPLRGCPTRTPAVASVGVLYPFQIITVSTIGELTEWLACQEIRPERGGVQITSLLSERQQYG